MKKWKYIGLDPICDTINLSYMFYFGRPLGTNHILDDIKCKDLNKYHKSKGYSADVNDTDFFYYEVEKREKMNIGDQVSFKQKNLYVNQYNAKFHQGELIIN